MNSTLGRPRVLTDAQVTIILTWHAQILAWKALRRNLKTQRQLARELNVSAATIAYVVRCGGKFKQASPEKRQRELLKRRGRFAQMRKRGLA